MSKLKNKAIIPLLENPKMSKFTSQIQHKLPNLLKIIENASNNPKTQTNRNQPKLIQHQNYQPQQFSQKSNKAQKFTELWTQVRNIKNANEKQQSKQIMAKTLPIQKDLENTKKKLEAEIIACNERLNNLYQDLHKIYQKFHIKKQQLKKEQVNRKKQIYILKQKFKNLLTSQLYDLLNQKESYKCLMNQIEQFKSKILSVNSQIEKLNNQKKELKKLYKINMNTLIAYYYESLKYGYDYRDYGIQWIIISLMKLNLHVKLSDFPEILDKKSKEYLLYQQNNNNQSKLPKIRQRKIMSTSLVRNISDNSIQNNIHIKNIYLNTKNYLNQMIKNRGSFQLDFVSNPEIISYNKQDDYERQIKEYERILLTYPRDIQNRVLKMVFGTRKNQIRLKF